jgi:hypothetical protein
MAVSRHVPIPTNGTICLARFSAFKCGMTKTENRVAARAYAAEKKRRFEEEREQAGRAADLEALRVIRRYLRASGGNK